MSGSVRGVNLFYKDEYCGTPQSKEGRNREHKACLNERTILRLLDQDVTKKSGCFSAPEIGDFSKKSGILQLAKMGPFTFLTYVTIFGGIRVRPSGL